MGRGGRGPSPNDDRSRSMNPQDPVGQAAMANEARQRGDDDWDDGYDDDVQSEGIMVTIEPDDDRSHWGVYRDEPRQSEAWRNFDPFENGYDWKALKAKSKPSDE